MFETALLYFVLAYRYGLNLAGLSYDWLDTRVVRYEQRLGPRVFAAVLTFLLMVGAAIYARPAAYTSALGSYYAQLATNPFSTAPNEVGYRILTPLISYCLGLRGEWIIVTNLLFAGILIYLVYRYFRTASPRPGDAFIAAVVMTFSLVTLSTLYYGGYCDSLTYLIIFLMWRVRRKAVWFYLLLFLGLTNRESIGFLIPWFAALTYQESADRRQWVWQTLVGLGLSVGLYFLYRQWIGGLRPVEFSIGYYIGPLVENPLKWIKRSVLNWPIGIFAVFKLLWVVVIIAAVHLWQSGRRRIVYSFALLLVCAAIQLAVATDTSRLITMAFLLIVFSLEYLFTHNTANIRSWVGWLILASLAVPQLYAAGEHIYVMQPLVFNLIAAHYVALPH